MIQTTKLKRVLPAFFLSFMLTALITMAFVPIVHAADPTETNLKACSTYGIHNGIACTSVTLVASTTVIVDTIAGSNTTGPAYVISAVSDTKSLGWAQAYCETQASIIPPPGKTGMGQVNLCEYYAYTGAASGSDTITINFTAGAIKSDVMAVIIDQLTNGLQFAGVVQYAPAVNQLIVPGSQTFTLGIPNPTTLAQPTFIHASVQAAACIQAVGTACGGSGSPVAYADANPSVPFDYDSGEEDVCQNGGSNLLCVAQGALGHYQSTLPGGTLGAFLTINPGTQEAYIMTLIVTYWTSNGSITPGGNTTQSQTVGATTCPTAAAKAATYLKNNTQFWYSGNALGQEVVNNIYLTVGSIKGSASQDFRVMIYTSTGQSPGVYPAVLVYDSGAQVVTAGSKNLSYDFQVNIPLNSAISSPLPFNFWAVAVVGTDHIKVVNSSVSGMTSQTGNPSTTAQPGSFTGQGSASSDKLGLCAAASYQGLLLLTQVQTTSIFTGGTATTTVFNGGTLTGVISTTQTVTNTINTIGPEIFATNSNWPIIFLILLIPAGLFMGATKSLAGGLLGLMIGSVIGLMMGILPGFIFIGIVIALVALAFVVRERSN